MNNCPLHKVYVMCYFGEDVMDSLISYPLRLGHLQSNISQYNNIISKHKPYYFFWTN